MRQITRSIRLVVIAGALLLIGVTSASAHARSHPARCTVPRLSSVTLKVARERIDHAGCRVGTIHRPKTAAANEIVSRQSPKAGRRIRRGSKVTVWLKTKTAPVTLTTPTVTIPTPTPTISYSTGVDPTFVQSPTDPLNVTYTYDATALQTVNGVTTNLATTGTLPAGVLNFYNGSALTCSMNVGGATSSGTCAITYPATGTYQVTTQYIPTGATAVTETDSETVSPVGSTSSLSCTPTPPPTNYPTEECFLTTTGANGMPVLADSVDWTITDTTTNQPLGTYSEPPGVVLEVIPAWDGNVQIGYTVAFMGSGGPVQETNILSSSTDAISAQATYPGSATAGYAPSASATVSLAF